MMMVVGFPGVESTITERLPCTPSSGRSHPETRSPAAVVSVAAVSDAAVSDADCESFRIPNIFMMFFGDSCFAIAFISFTSIFVSCDP